ncbi:TraB/VirB10 family protein [Chromobacterium sp. IIBBL 290-4]|uniref:TraB/VirB10 family protein n=1 Tax=Chromobacterium sp. IIBBL 290-4 TaxID=2953890 RepID=UPI0020B8F556|nr:TraB/VirB10 family protein [Chromobacterium sp. IIBBL 290-4]UTH74240.1 hypothetical protein NKT35_22320 [Chromobacterium sp. IIBBL 290-4]
MKDAIRSRWEQLSPQSQRVLMVVSVLAALGLVSYLVLRFGEMRKPPVVKPTTIETHVMTGSRRDMNLESLGGQLTAQQGEIERIKQILTKNDRQMSELASDVSEKVAEQLKSDSGASSGELAQLRDRVKMLEAKPAPSDAPRNGPPSTLGNGPPALSSPLTPSVPLSDGPPPATAKNEGRSVTQGGFRVMSNSARQALQQQAQAKGEADRAAASQPAASHEPNGPLAKGAASAQTPARKDGAEPAGSGLGEAMSAVTGEGASGGDSVWLPAGAMMTGVLLNGMDAPTAAYAQKNPTPVLIRLKTVSILPNRARLDLRECFAMASGYGVMSTERAQLRTELLSCVRKDGGVIETALNGYVVGEDGKVGVRGRLVSKQGSLLAASMASGLFGGLAQALKPQPIIGLNTSALSGSIQTQTPNASDILSAGAYQGASSALDNVSKFYLDMAKEMFPVIEIDAARKVEIIITKGSSLRLQSAKPSARTQLGRFSASDPNIRN